MKPCFRVLFQTVIDQPFERGRDVLVCLGKIGWVFFQDRAHRFSRRFAMKGAPARKHLVKNCAEGKDVRTMIDRAAFDLFRRHITNGAHHYTWISLNTASWYFSLRQAAIRLG